MGHFGFSYVGTIYLLMLMIPNLFWTQNKPLGYENVVCKENKVLLWFERVGQFLVTPIAVMFSDYNLKPFSPWSVWLIVSFLLMLIYEMSWIHYFRSEHTLEDFYGEYLGIPVPGALLPVAAFFLLSIYGKVIWLAIAVIILGIGHIGIHIQHRMSVRNGQYSSNSCGN